MPATKDQLFSERSTVGGAGYTWAAHDVAAGGRWVLAIFIGDGPGARTVTSITGSTLGTFDHVVTALNTAQEKCVSIWQKWAPNSITGEVLTQVDGGGAFYNRRSFLFVTVQGSDSSGAGASAASAVGATGGDPSISVNPQAPDSYLIAGVTYRESGTANQAPTGGATLEYTTGDTGSFAFNEMALSRASTGTGSHTLALAGNDVTGDWQMAVVEIKAAAGAGGGDLSAHIGEPITGSSVLN